MILGAVYLAFDGTCSSTYNCTANRFLNQRAGFEPVHRTIEVHIQKTTSEVPAFVQAEEPLYMGGPIRRINVISSAWRGAPLSNR
jgi:hypothetical protein